MVRVVERHGVIRFRARHRPGRYDRHGVPIDNSNVLGGGYIDEDPRRRSFQCEGPGMPSPFPIPKPLAARWTDRRKRPAAVSDVESLRDRVVPNVVRILAERARLRSPIIIRLAQLS